MNKVLLISIILIVTGVGIYFYIGDIEVIEPQISKTYKASNGEISKIVYKIDDISTLAVCQRDCDKRNGLFQECGNICEPGAQACVEVCGVTCTI
jgi:hypothetical protein